MIIKALNLDGLVSHVSDWKYKTHADQEEDGAQIDLVIERNYGAITLCEIKYSKASFSIDSWYITPRIRGFS